MSKLNWRKVKTHAPSISGKYLVRLQAPFNQTYADLAYYFGNVAKWFSFSRINGQDMILDDITNIVISFVDELVENSKNDVRQSMSKN